MKNHYGSVTFCAVICALGGIALAIVAIYSFVNELVGIGFGYLAGAVAAFIETAAITCINANAANVVDNYNEIKKLKEENAKLIERIKNIEDRL